MVNQRYCPFCGVAARTACQHLALAVPGRDFVQSCIAMARAERQWTMLCKAVRDQFHRTGACSVDREDFTWLETAFCERFLKHLRWFGGMDHEWRTGPELEHGGFYVLLWSKSPQRLFWELLDNIDRQLVDLHSAPVARRTEPDWFSGLRQGQT